MKYCKSCNVCYDTNIITQQHCESPDCMHDCHVVRNITKNLQSYGCRWANQYDPKIDNEYWCKVCNLHWSEKSKHHNKQKCNYFDAIKKSRTV